MKSFVGGKLDVQNCHYKTCVYLLNKLKIKTLNQTIVNTETTNLQVPCRGQ